MPNFWPAMGLRNLYSPFRVASMRQEAAVRFSYGFTGSAASTILFSGKLYEFEKKIISP